MLVVDPGDTYFEYLQFLGVEGFSMVMVPVSGKVLQVLWAVTTVSV